MLALKLLLFVAAVTLFIIAAAIAVCDVWQGTTQRRRALAAGVEFTAKPVRWRTSVAFALLAWLPLLTAFAIAVVPSGRAGVKVSQLRCLP